VGDRKEEHTIQFAIDDWWISDYNSYIFPQPATMFLVAVEEVWFYGLTTRRRRSSRLLNINMKHFPLADEIQ
jgi:hypothetical protein